MTPAMRVRLVMCAAGGDIPPTSVMRWLPAGTTLAQIQTITDMWDYGQRGRAWDMARDLVNGGTA